MILVCGDQHGEFGELNSILAKKQPEICIVCGDMGYWPVVQGSRDGGRVLRTNFEKNRGVLDNGEVLTYLHAIKPQKTKVLFCDGNHEQHHMLRYLVEEAGGRFPIEVAESIYYMPRGSSYELPDGRRALFMGGASSIDYRQRVDGWDWFSKEEIISQEDLDAITPQKYDILISHTCPDCMVDTMMEMRQKDRNDPSTKALQHIVETYRPALSLFGHWHRYVKRTIKDTTYIGLSIPGKTGWWVTI